MEQVLVKSQMDEFLEENLVKLSKGKYVSTAIMLVKKENFDNWIKRQKCVETIDLSPNGHNYTRMPCHC
jgi:hypothetical protein